MKKNDNKTLQKQWLPSHVGALALGCIIGWGYFVNPGNKFLSNFGVAGTVIVMIIIACSYAYMIPKYLKAGGEFTFTKECYGKNMAFACDCRISSCYICFDQQ